LDDATGVKFTLSQKSAGFNYGNHRENRQELRRKARDLAGTVDLIVASGGIVSARAAVAAAAREDTPVLICVGQEDEEVKSNVAKESVLVAGVNLNTPDQNIKRATELMSDHPSLKEEEIWLVVNNNSAMGRAERDRWDKDGRAFVETGKHRKNDEPSIRAALQYALANGAKAFIISSDPFLTSKAAFIRGMDNTNPPDLRTVPLCFAFRQCLHTAADIYRICWGHDLVAVYQKLGEQAKKALTMLGFPEVETIDPAKFTSNP
jgi:hypothetical protein